MTASSRCLPVLLCAAAAFAQAPDRRFDVVVAGGSSGGVGAALGAGRMGARVALVEDTPVLGGMLANGISNIDTFSYESLSGAFDEFRAGVLRYYAPRLAIDPIFRAPENRPIHMDGRSRQSNTARLGGRWEPHAADQVFKEMVRQVPSIEVFYNHFATGAILRGNRVAGVTVEDGQGRLMRFLADVVVDATHEADIAAWAGVPYRVGREARSPLEPHAGDILFFNGTGEIMAGSTGRQDAGVVSSGVRLVIQNYTAKDGTAHILSAPPPGYDKSKYVHASYRGTPDMPGGKSEMNVNPIGSELQELNWSWPDATRAERKRLYEIHRSHALGYLYYLQHELGLTHLGLPADEFTDNGNVPYRVFIREARRIEGKATMTEADINPFVTGAGLTPPLRPDSIAIGHYPIDSKPVHPKTDLATPDKGNGDFFLVNVAAPFQVPYGAIVPKKIDGLLVPVALSATHVAFSAVRMDPTWVVLGQAAGIAAALSAREGILPRELPVERLQRELLRQKCRLLFYWDLPLDHPAFAAVEWLSVRGAVAGYDDRLFRPDQALTRAELAALAVKAFGVWPSVSNAHFQDVPYRHWAFRYIETLFDRRALQPFGVEPRWPSAGGYVAAQHSGFTQDRAFGAFSPDRAVTWKELTGVLERLHPRAAGSAAWAGPVLAASLFGQSYAGRAFPPEAAVTRGEACALVAALLDGAAQKGDRQ